MSKKHLRRGCVARQAMRETEIAKFLQDFVPTEPPREFMDQDWLFSTEALQNLMGCTKETIQQAINAGTLILIEWVEGGQSLCLPGSCWDPNKSQK